MPQKKTVRKPQQARSIQMKEKILKTALKLFCKQGFYKTTTNDIAAAAGVSVASLYAYFKDRDAIFFEILEQYHQQFITLHTETRQQLAAESLDEKEWLTNFVAGLVQLHEQSREFNRELKVLYYSNPKVAAIMDRQNAESQQMIVGYLRAWKQDLAAEDLDIIAWICFDFISVIVDRIVYGGKTGEPERIQQLGVEALIKFLEL